MAPCLQTFTSASFSSIYAIALSPDGTTLATGSWEYLQLWNVSDGTCVQTITLPGSAYYVNALAFSPDGENLAYGCADDSLIIVRLSDLASVQTFTEYASPVTSLAFTPDEQKLADGSLDGVAMWTLSMPLSTVKLTTNPASPAIVGTPITLSATATGGTNVQYQFWVYNPSRQPGVEPTAGLFLHRDLHLDSDLAGQLLPLRHRAGWRDRHGSEYHRLVYDYLRHTDGSCLHHASGVSASGQYPDHPHRDGDGRDECAVSVLVL